MTATTYTWPALPAPGSTVRGEFWTYTTDEEGYWGAYHQDRPDRRQPVSTSPLNAIHAHGPFQVTAPDGTEYTLAVPDAPAVGTRLRGAKTGQVYELISGGQSDSAAKLRTPDGTGHEWVSALESEGAMTVLSPSVRYEVREDPEVDPRAVDTYPGQRYCVWDTHTDSVYRVDLSGSHPDDAASVTGGAPRFGPVSRESAQEMADHLNATAP